ncbi:MULTISPECIES: ABC transporter substrate-binding protein [Dethiosulfovibrio]|uniref:ABC transporter substrate-binding protein n=2 Tax=Dethiosulfovibrio TaxID=47054 RepID=A0ABS9ES42_9BACT|nr:MULTISPECIES: ABC transporter substrate-binding protein [Dethiosulfovibrio]MCF4114172.1 ABC transporter substrate-binding protein [Dethiosulfovibrio russensis]MCF4142638.1 ABC transporter substrate-binding protein [Dethiosulfovibrio marinus]MCF4145157.1 ABC transporter substrate-binding protein [Dethiosulfovibrio acidaminovorans]
MRKSAKFFSVILTLGVILSSMAASAGSKIVFADFSWESAQFHNRVAGYILEHGFDREVAYSLTEEMPGFLGLERGDLQLAMETWVDNSIAIWDKITKKGKVLEMGKNYPNAPQGWYVPTFIIKGDPERGIEPLAPDLRSVTDLPKYWKIFQDPENDDKGRFLNGPTGWPISIKNVDRLKAYGLDDTYVNFYAGSGAALAVGIASAFEKGRPVLAYYWEPTPLLGKYDMTKLEESPYDPKVWKETGMCAFPACRVLKTGNRAFLESEPEIRDFVERYETSLELTSEALAVMDTEGMSSPQAAEWFLKEHPEVWSSWVDEEVRAKVSKALGL